jgi:AcrR family transcriptional regulator
MNRLERRKSETHDSILQAATALIAESGLGGFSLEAVADRADVSRATLYNHYADRSGLLREVLEPVFRRAIKQVENMLRSPKAIDLDGICALCLELWEGHVVRFGLVDPAPDPELLGEVERQHRKFGSRFAALFVPLGRRIPLRVPPLATGRLVYRCFVPILESIAGRPDFRELFREMVGSLVTAGPTGAAPDTSPRPPYDGALRGAA